MQKVPLDKAIDIAQELEISNRALSGAGCWDGRDWCGKTAGADAQAIWAVPCVQVRDMLQLLPGAIPRPHPAQVRQVRRVPLRGIGLGAIMASLRDVRQAAG